MVVTTVSVEKRVSSDIGQKQLTHFEKNVSGFFRVLVPLILHLFNIESVFISDSRFAPVTNSIMNLERKQEMFKSSCFITQLVALAVRVAEGAGNIVKEWAFSGTGKRYYKGPVSLRDFYTDADIAAEDCIISSLRKYFGGSLKIIGEESVQPTGTNVVEDFDPDVLMYDSKCDKEVRRITSDDVVVWVDPLDGTYELVTAEGDLSRQQEVTVLIGVSYQGRPVAGVIHQPFWGADVTGRTVWAIKGIGVHGIEVVKNNSKRYAVTTRSHSTPQIRETLNILKEKNLISDVEFVGGAGFKVLKCLDGAAAYVFPSPGCKKWDTCAPEAIITASGGRLTDISGSDLYYGANSQIPNNGGVLATAHWVNHQEFVDCIPEEIKKLIQS